jgi:hypothetical protein
MKKIGKLSINLEKVIKNEELVNLRGGYYGSGDCPSGQTKYICQCSPGVGTWTGCYSSQSKANEAISEWCEGGTGSCS